MQQGIFPKEVTSNVPLITLTGHEQLHIEQHQGLVDYEPDNIVLRSACGLIRIAGALALALTVAGRDKCGDFSFGRLGEASLPTGEVGTKGGERR